MTDETKKALAKTQEIPFETCAELRNQARFEGPPPHRKEKTDGDIRDTQEMAAIKDIVAAADEVAEEYRSRTRDRDIDGTMTISVNLPVTGDLHYTRMTVSAGNPFDDITAAVDRAEGR